MGCSYPKMKVFAHKNRNQFIDTINNHVYSYERTVVRCTLRVVLTTHSFYGRTHDS